jgi:adenosylcobinamide-phosphate synthase
MSFFAVLFALLIEQFKPLAARNPVHDGLSGWVRWVGRNFDAGAREHANVVWAITVVGPALMVALLSAWLDWLDNFSALLTFAWHVLVLYVTLGFRQFSHHFTDIRDALDQGREDKARELLSEWRHLDVSDMPRDELLRHVLEYAFLAAHRHVFGVFFWYVVLAMLGLGPAGAVLYRMAEFTHRYWTYRSHTTGENTHAGLMARAVQMFQWMDYVPVRLTAFGFAVVGNFEEVADSWRRFSGLWKQPNEGVILAAAAGALGVRLGGQVAPATGQDMPRTLTEGGDPEVLAAEGTTAGEPPRMDHLRSAVGLIWRSVVLWMLLLALLSLANRVG